VFNGRRLALPNHPVPPRSEQEQEEDHFVVRPPHGTTGDLGAEERFQLLVESVQDYAIFMLDPSGRVTSWNRGAERIKGYRREEIIGRHFSIFYTAPDLARRKPARGLAAAERRGRWVDEGYRVRKDGSQFLASVTITALRDEAGTLRGFAKVTRDITHMRKLQERVLNAERRETSRMRELAAQMRSLEELKSQFLKLASHELRTPVSLIRGYLSLFEDGGLGPLNEDGLAAVAVLREQSAHLHFLVDQLLQAAAVQAGSIELSISTMDLREQLHHAVSWAREIAGPGQSVELTVPEVPVLVAADPDRLGMILRNLLDNAIKYSPEGSPVRSALSQSSREAHVRVSDDGIGVPREQRRRLFDAFGRHVNGDTASIRGAGLGLYLARSLARLHGGDVELEPESSGGSTFLLTLPLAI
jgi:PAS domain S-box-containing protein